MSVTTTNISSSKFRSKVRTSSTLFFCGIACLALATFATAYTVPQAGKLLDSVIYLVTR